MRFQHVREWSWACCVDYDLLFFQTAGPSSFWCTRCSISCFNSVIRPHSPLYGRLAENISTQCPFPWKIGNLLSDVFKIYRTAIRLREASEHFHRSFSEISDRNRTIHYAELGVEHLNIEYDILSFAPVMYSVTLQALKYLESSEHKTLQLVLENFRNMPFPVPLSVLWLCISQQHLR